MSFSQASQTVAANSSGPGVVQQDSAAAPETLQGPAEFVKDSWFRTVWLQGIPSRQGNGFGKIWMSSTHHHDDGPVAVCCFAAICQSRCSR